MPDGETRLERMTRKEFREALDAGSFGVGIIPVGSIEQHLEHLPLGHDTASCTYIAERVAERLYPAVVVAVPIAAGISEHHMAHRGTLSAKPGTFLATVFDAAESLVRHGVENVLILNGHGGNVAPLESAMRQWKLYFENTHPETELSLYSYWQSIPAGFAEQVLDGGRFPGHAGEFETSVALYALPGTVRSGALRDTDDPEPATATAEKGRLLVEKIVDGLAHLVRQMQTRGRG